MGLFGTKSKSSRKNQIRDWSTGPITRQSHIAPAAPDVNAYVSSIIEEASRTDRADPAKVLESFSRVFNAQMDKYAALTQVGEAAVVSMREELYARPDFRFEMLFDGLTYFGPSGIAMSQQLIKLVDNSRTMFVESTAEGKFDRD